MVCLITTRKDYTKSPGMDLPTENMFDRFKDEIWKELGPLDPDWFQVLTAQTSTIEDSVSDVSDELCANQEGHFKTPLDKTALDSQLFSTPKVFRHSRVVSPETEDEFTAKGKETLTWKETQSPHLFRMEKDRVQAAKHGGICPQSQDGYDLLHPSPKSPVNYAKRISETLGAQVDPDLSWTSSLNTPPAVPSTLILSKPDESPCPVSVSADKNVVFVRKLFPSLSNLSRVVAASSENHNVSVHQGVVSPEARHSQSHADSPTLLPSPRVWRQKLPDAIEDGDVRRTIENVLDGAENVLSIFFSNSSSALRKVKTDRIKRKQVIPTDVSNPDAEQRTDVQDLEKLSSPPPLQSRDIRTTQWSPLSLSEIPPWTTEASCCENNPVAKVENNVLTEKSQRDSSTSQLAGLTLQSTHCGLLKKKRKFIYTVNSSKTQDEGKGTPSQITDTSALVPDPEHKVKSVKVLVKDGDEAGRHSKTQKRENVMEENQLLPTKSKLQDLDMSQLCRDFAQDFSQTLDSSKVSVVSQDAPQNGFSPSACLTAVRQAKQKARQANNHLDCDAISHRKVGCASNQNGSINEGTVSDSGFQSAVADITRLTTTFPSPENWEQTQQWTGFKSDSVIFAKGINEKPLDDNKEAETDVDLPSATMGSQTLDLLQTEQRTTEETDNTLCQVRDGFKAASNKAIQKMSSAQLDRAKSHFGENKAEKTLKDQPSKGARSIQGEIVGVGNGLVENAVSYSNQPPSSRENTTDVSYQLTASQKADVTELCTLLEEAESQFEFTQFKMTKPPQQDNTRSLNKVDIELDPDFLLGIDFDDSFNIDTTKTVASEKMASFTDGETSGEALRVTRKSLEKNKNAMIKDVSSPSELISKGSHSVLSVKPQNPNKSNHQESKNPLLRSAGFRTVSKKCMSKAKALFADVEGNLTDHKSADEKNGDSDGKTEHSPGTSKNVTKKFTNGNMDGTLCHSGFQMASGKGISISAEAMQEADALFKDCDISHNNTILSVKVQKSKEQSPSFSSNTKKQLETKSIHKIKVGFSEEPNCDFEKVNADPAVCHTEVVLDNVESLSLGFEKTPASHGNLPLTCITSKSCGSSANDQSNSGGGFCTASGKKVSVSADALKKAECLLNEEMKEHLTEKDDALKPSNPTNQTLQSGGFQRASGKGVVISSAALKRAKSLLSECEAVHDGVNVKPNNSKKPVHGASSGNNGFLAASGKPMSFSSEALQKAKSLFSDITVSEETLNVSNANGSGKNPIISKEFLSPLCTLSNNYGSSANNQSISGGGFSTASGKKVSVSVDALKKATCLLNEVHMLEEMTEHPTQEGDGLKTGQSYDQTLQNGGFQTASGKGVVISSEALKRAKSLLSECEAVDDKKPVHGVSSSINGFIKAGEETLKASATRRSSKNPKFSSAFSSPPCTMSKTCVSSANNQSNSGGGFCTASGKKVSVSSDALKKAECLLNEDYTIEDIKKHLTLKEDCLKADNHADHIQNGGFQTASGKGVISSAALKRAKSLLSECEGAGDKKTNNSEIPVCGVSVSNSEFLAASGKPVAFSSKALQKAKAIFGDISLSEETLKVSDTMKSSEKQDGAGNCVSQKTLLKAANVVKELDDLSVSEMTMQEAGAVFRDGDMDGTNEMSVEYEEGVTLLSENANEEKTSESKPDLMLTNTSDAHRSSTTKFENFNVGINVISSLSGSAINPTSSPSFSNFGGSSGGFSSASGKKVLVSDEALTKAKSLLNDSVAFKDTNKNLQPKQDNSPPQNCDEGGAISFDAQKKEKGVSNIEATHSTTPLSCLPPTNGGFLAASGKPVAVSAESLQRAKAVFNDIDFCSLTCDTKRSHEETPNNAGNPTCGFRTAGGAKVHVSQKNLLKAKSLFKEVADENSCDSNSYPTRRHNAHKSDITEVKSMKRTLNFNLTARDKQETKRSVPRVDESFQPLRETDHENESPQDSRMHNCISYREKPLTDKSEFKEGKIEETFTSPWVGNPHYSTTEEVGNVSGSEVNHTSGSEGPRFKRAEGTSLILFQSLNLSGCTTTQQEFLAQEALDCTKALLGDESLAGNRLSVTLENEPLQDDPESNPRSMEGQIRKGKRAGEDTDMTVQPPLKRRLLEEFDRTVDEPRGSALQPQKCSPNSVMKDRRVFKYSVSPHPNITRPHGSGKHYVESGLQNPAATQHSSKSTHSKTPTFVPPFVKNAKTESRMNTNLNVNVKTPSAFVPPFKKQRTVAQEGFSIPHIEKDKQPRLFIPPSNCSIFVPPTKKSQSAAGVDGDKANKDMTTVTLADSKLNLQMSCHDLPAGCVSEESAAEASFMEDLFSTSKEVSLNLENVEMARDMQDMRIRKKKRQTIRPLPGSLFLTRTSGVKRIPLKAALNGKPPARCSTKQLYECGIHQHVCEISSENAETFRFSLKQFINMEAFADNGGVQLADGGWLIPRNDGTAGKEEFYRALCDTPGVDPKLMSEEWVFNHYRWIVWKQAAMERSFPETLGSLCLTPEQVLLQLKYRYDVEIDHSRRPALRKIMEKDDTAAKTLLLCVCGIVSSGCSPNKQSRSDTKSPDAKVEPSSAVVWLTDGWYAIKAQLDEPLTAMLRKGRLADGGKVITYGAQLVGSQDACSPLEAPESLMLKICANSTRPARWDTKLGFHKDPRPFPLPLSSLFSDGGPVGCVDITVLRTYPVQWMERKQDGGVVFRSVRAEEKEARRYNKHKQKAMEILFAKIQSEFEKEQKGNDKPQHKRRTMTRQEVANLQDGEELHEAVGDDPAYFEAHLSEQQLATLQSYRRSLMEKQRAELQDRYRRAFETESSDGTCPNRDITPVWRLCVADSVDQRGRIHQLNLWRPSLDLQSLLKEGCRYRVYNVATSDGKRRGGIEAVQLTGTKKTQFQDLLASQEWLSTHFKPRVSTNFVDLQNTDYQTVCGEVDLAGYIISLVDEHGSSPAFYMADGSLNFVKVRCFSSFAHSGLDDVVKPRVLFALSNLQLRGQSTHPTPVVYAGDLTVFSTNPKEAHLQESLGQLRSLVQGQENFFRAAEERLSLLIKSDGASSVSSPAVLHPRTPGCAADGRQDAKTTSLISQHPVRSLGSVTPVSVNLPPAERDPRSLKRRRALDYLSCIPSPPSLSHLSSAASLCVKKTFNPPRRSATPSTLKTAQTPAPKPAPLPVEDEWVNDEELAMIDTQNLRVGDSL